jgi:hypothetical protein
MWKTLRLRAERPAAFAGAYEPLELGPGICAYVRGGEVLVAAALRPDAELLIPPGWQDELGVPGLALAYRSSDQRAT